MPEYVEICQRPPAGSLEYIAARLEAAVEDGTEQTLRTVALQAMFSLRMLAAETEEQSKPEPPPRPRILNMVTGDWVPVADADLADFIRDPDGVVAAYQQRFRREWDAEHPEDTRD